MNLVERIKSWEPKRVKQAITAGIFVGMTVYYSFILPKQQPDPVITPTTPVQTALPIQETESIDSYFRIGSYNIENFGQSKAGKPEVMDILAETFCDFPIMGIQEIQYKDHEKELLDNFTARIEDTCEQPRDYIVSERQQESDENYAIVFDPRIFNLITEYQYPDNNNDFVREPFGGYFEVRNGNLDFLLLVYHIKPDTSKTEQNDTYEELLHLNDVHIAAQRTFPGEGDIIFSGDMNVGYLNSGDWDYLLPLTDFRSLIEEGTSLAGKPHDKFLITNNTLEDYTGNSGVYMFDIIFNLSEEFADDVSDHYPIWMEVYTNRDTD